MARLNDEQAGLFLDKNFGWATTVRDDGTPHATPVWVDYDPESGDVLFNITPSRTKYRYLQRDPRVTVSVFDRENPYRYVAVTGRAELEPGNGAWEHINRLSQKYRGTDYGAYEDRVTVRVKPERVNASV